MGNETMRIAVFGRQFRHRGRDPRGRSPRRGPLRPGGPPAEPLEALAADLVVRGAKEAAVLVADLADLDALPRVAAGAWERLGGLEPRLHRPRHPADQTLLERDAVAARQAIEINFISPALLANASPRCSRAAAAVPSPS